VHHLEDTLRQHAREGRDDEDERDQGHGGARACHRSASPRAVRTTPQHHVGRSGERGTEDIQLEEIQSIAGGTHSEHGGCQAAEEAATATTRTMNV
jgi:hypothetical protein